MEAVGSSLQRSRPENDAMRLTRRRFLHLGGAAALADGAPSGAFAQTYPTRPVRLISGFPAGGPNDIVARLVGQLLWERLGQPFIVENRPGAGSNVATEAVVRAAPDGYTLLLVNSPNAINATLYDNLNFVFLRDIAPVVGIARTTLIMEVHPSVPVRTVPEFIAYAKANPGKINFASAGKGSPQHVSGELFKMMTGVNMVHVPYRGAAPALIDLIAGHVQAMIDTMPGSIDFVRAGKLRPLAVTSLTRWPGLEDLPTVNDFVPGYQTASWYGIGVPRNTPADIIDKLNREINAGLADPNVKARLADLGATVVGGSAADFGKLIADETEKWGKVVEFAGIKPD
jgi:tripartite-type tricarboxylate transporter receptor subunit TctC